MKDVLSVPSHPHRLKAENLQDGYLCDACKERGTELRYTCRTCNYDVHNFCATASPSIPHPFSDAKMILLSTRVVRDSIWCSACERSVLGLRYSCSASGDVLHPCCAHLPKTETMDSNTLRFCKNLSTDPCNVCKKRNKGWAYVSTDYSFHVRCLEEGLATLESPEFDCYSNGLELTAAASSSYPPPAQGGCATSGTQQKYQPDRSKKGFKGFCKKTKWFLKALRAVISGNPYSTSQVYASFALDQ